MPVQRKRNSPIVESGNALETNAIDEDLVRGMYKLPNVNILPPPQHSSLVHPDDPILFVKSNAVQNIENAIKPESKRKKRRVTFAPDIVEGLKPMRKPETQSQRTQRQNTRDTTWYMEYMVELGLIILGFSSAYMLYYYLFDAPAAPEKSTYNTGVNFIDWFINHQVSPALLIRWLIASNGPLSSFTSYLKSGSSIFVLIVALLSVVGLLLGKSGIIKMVQNAVQMKASSGTHVIIAWSYLSAIFALTIANLFGWVTNPFGSLVSVVFIVVFNHVVAGIAQLGLISMLLYLLSGVEKYWTTGIFGVTIPDPFTKPCADTMGNCHVPAPPQQVNTIDGINKIAFTILQYIKEIVLILFGIIKSVNCNMQTYSGGLAAYGTNAILIGGALVSIAFKWSSSRSSVEPMIVPFATSTTTQYGGYEYEYLTN